MCEQDAFGDWSREELIEEILRLRREVEASDEAFDALDDYVSRYEAETIFADRSGDDE